MTVIPNGRKLSIIGLVVKAFGLVSPQNGNLPHGQIMILQSSQFDALPQGVKMATCGIQFGKPPKRELTTKAVWLPVYLPQVPKLGT